MIDPYAPGPVGELPLTWHCERLQQISSIAWHRIMRLRQQVFVVEQQCIYADADEADEHAWHLWARQGDGSAVACSRIVDPGVKYPEPSIGRVSTRLDLRAHGLGRELVGRAVAQCGRLHPGHGIRISAQQRLEAFYAAFGFQSVGAAYLEDGMPHIEMLRPAEPQPPG